MGNLKLNAQQGMLYKKDQLKTLKIKPEATLNQVKSATKDNNLDEVVLKDKQGHLHVAYADELSVKGGSLPNKGELVNVDFVDGTAEVVHVDNEWNEDFYTGVVQTLNNPKIYSGDDTKLKKLAEKPPQK